MNNSVAIVEDNNDIRQALEQIIESSGIFTLSGSCSTGEEALGKITHPQSKSCINGHWPWRWDQWD